LLLLLPKLLDVAVIFMDTQFGETHILAPHASCMWLKAAEEEQQATGILQSNGGSVAENKSWGICLVAVVRCLLQAWEESSGGVWRM
jgi:hypothetical protein